MNGRGTLTPSLRREPAGPRSAMERHEYETDLDSRVHTRSYADEATLALSALECVLNGRRAVYASSELTTGTRLYAALGENGHAGSGQLADPHRSAVLKLNTEAAAHFAERLERELDDPVVTPAHFAAPGWTQAEYLAFWERLIREKVKAVYFNQGWEYSNGCTFEYAVALEARLPTYDSEGAALAPAEAAAKVERAIADVEARGFDATRLRINLERLRSAAPAG